MDEPLISIIMSVQNCEETLMEALDSIALQTYSNWELAICDDGSSDGTPQIIEEYRQRMGDARVHVLSNSVNRKLAFSLNRCLGVARGEFIARMDGDDISEPDRLEKQLEYLLKHPEVDLVGTAMRRFNREVPGEVVHPAAEAPDKWTLGRTTRAPFLHATILTRRSVYDAVGNYTVSWRTERGQDLDLWFKFFAAGLCGRNMIEPLYRVREDAAAIRRRTARARIGSYATRLRGNWMLGYAPTAYVRCTLDVLKIFIPYKVFDWHRRRSYARARTTRSL